MTISVLFCLALVLAGGERVGAAGGGLDPSFNPGGAGADGMVDVVAVQPDGKILVGGRFKSYNGNAAASNYIARLNANGTLDTSFNPAGLGSDGLVLAIALQPDGKIVLGGSFTSYNRNDAVSNRVMRLNANGTLDTTFNPGGVGADGNVFAVALQPDGKILIGGRFYTYNGTDSEGIARLNSDGTLDASFNPTGSGAANLTAIVVQPDGKIVIAGNFIIFFNVPGSFGKIKRLNSDGTVDASFNPGGSGADGMVNAVALQPNGKIIIGGSFTMYNGDGALPDKVARLNANGTRDTTFNPGGAGADGMVSGNYPEVKAVAVQPDGRIVIGGEFASYNGNAAASDAVARLNSNGTLDASFNPTGSGADSFVSALALQADGKVLVGGNFTSYNGDAAANDRLTRLLPAAGDIAFSSASYSVAETAANALITLTRTGGTDNKVVAKVTLADNTTTPADYRFKPGTLDASFNPGGAGADATVYAVAVQPDGKVIIAGSFTSYNGDGAASDHVMRLNTNGTRDTTFNPGGAGADNNVYDVALQPDGKILIGGIFTSYNGNAAANDGIARLNANGSLDTSFNPGGTGVDTNTGVNSLALQPDGKIVIGGSFTSYNGVTGKRVTRLNANGSLDTTFNNGGSGVDGPVIHEVALQADGKIIIGGNFTGYNLNSAASDGVARLDVNGKLDPTFNSGGDGVGRFSHVTALAVQADGKIIIGGSFVSYNGSFTAPDSLARLNTSGKLDPTFNPGGSGANLTVFEIDVQPDGKLVIGGSFTSYNDNEAASDYVARLNANGTLDASFNAGGYGADYTVFDVAVQPDGKVIIAGDFTVFNGDDAICDRVARLAGDLFVTWPTGDASNKTVLLPIVNDTVFEGDETLNLALSIVAGGATLGAPASSALTIVDNEAPPKLSVNNVTVAEGNSGTVNAAFTVSLAGASSKPVTVNYQTVNVTATAPADYTAVPLTTLTFAPGQTSKTVTVPVKGDLIDELNETFKVVLSGPTNATILTGTGVGTITDDDAATISINNVSVTEPDSGTAAITFTVSLSVASSRTVTVKYATANGTAAAPADYTALALTTLSFSPGQTSKTVTVFVKGDLLKEANETFFVNLSAATNATISDAQGLGTILNDD